MTGVSTVVPGSLDGPAAPRPAAGPAAGAGPFADVLAAAVGRTAGSATRDVAALPSITMAAALGLATARPVPVLAADGSVRLPAGSADGLGAASGSTAGEPSGSAGAWARRLPTEGQRWAPAIEAAARRHGIDPPLLAALVRAESGFRADAVSHAGATGLTQLMPATARGLGVDPSDPLANLDGGARFLKSMLDRFGRTDLALAAYNAGPGRVQRAGGIPAIRETQAYVPKVLRYYQELR